MLKQNNQNMLMHIVGNRPQFIKLAPLSHELNSRGYQDTILHTGQHYDNNMSNIFFEELGIKKPFKNLNIGSGTHAVMTGSAMVGIEETLMESQPKAVVLYGDTDSTLAAALAAVKLGVPVIHIEAGPRTHMENNPEEYNRILTDHVSSILCCPDRHSVYNLKAEGIMKGVYYTGDIMYDTYLYASKKSQNIFLKNIAFKKDYILMTWHRQENTESRDCMEKILEFLAGITCDIVCPMHPRTRQKLVNYDLWEKALEIKNFNIIEPMGYMEMVKLMNGCKLVLTDSGGLSKESYFAGVRCLFMLNTVLWPDLYENHWISNINFDVADSIAEGISLCNGQGNPVPEKKCNFYGDGHTARNIVDVLEKEGIL